MTAGPLRILHFVSPASVGGLERVVHALAIGHRAQGMGLGASLIGQALFGETLVGPIVPARGCLGSRFAVTCGCQGEGRRGILVVRPSLIVWVPLASGVGQCLFRWAVVPSTASRLLSARECNNATSLVYRRAL